MNQRDFPSVAGRMGLLMMLTAVASAQTPTTADTVRFLEQSTFGPTQALITQVQASGFSAYLDAQFALPATSYPNLTLQPTTVPTTCTGICVYNNYSMYPIQVSFFTNALTAPDQVRQRVSFALQQIMVASGLVNNQPSWMTPYLQVFDQDGLGNFRTLLQDITLNPAMGNYLNMAGNSKTAPNENYGREVLQLFTVGLNLLNQDGTQKVDASGNPIPTYSQATVDGFANVFTGWNLVAGTGTGTTFTPNYTTPMVLTPANHSAGSKLLLDLQDGNGPVTIPAVTTVTAATAAADLKAALDNIFHHPNVGPFIATRLIQHLVTSNPSPAYVSRVAAIFNDNGAGTRGDLKAVVKAILLDTEARNPTPDVNFGHLTEPVLFITKLLRLFNTSSTTSDFVLGDGYMPSELVMGQNLFLSPSVFNYYPPDYTVPATTINGPEFNLQSTSTSFARVNFVAETVYKTMSANSVYRPTGTWINFAPFLSTLPTSTPSPLLLTSTLNTLMLHGSMSANLHSIVNLALNSMTGATPTAMLQRAVYLIGSSPEYFVQR